MLNTKIPVNRHLTDGSGRAIAGKLFDVERETKVPSFFNRRRRCAAPLGAVIIIPNGKQTDSRKTEWARVKSEIGF